MLGGKRGSESADNSFAPLKRSSPVYIFGRKSENGVQEKTKWFWRRLIELWLELQAVKR